MGHLQGTCALLSAWEAPRPVCIAGLFHSVYGTESYPNTVVPLNARGPVRAAIGDTAENLAYLFGVMNKASFYAIVVANRTSGEVAHRNTGELLPIDAFQVTGLCHMVVANWLEQRPRVAAQHKFIRADEFRAMRPYLTAAACSALDDAYGFRP